MVLALLVVLAALLYLNRRAAAREVLVGWLDRRGIEADVEVERIELDGFVGRVRIGDADNPDVTVERVEVDYAVTGPWSERGLGVTPGRIRLVRPVLRASWRAGKLSLGSLDPLVEDFTGRPPSPDSRGPLVVVERGRLRLDTEYGPLQLLGDARIDDGKLMRLSASMPAASLKSGDIEARALGGTLDMTTTGDRIAVRLDLGADRFAAAATGGRNARLKLNGDLPYPDLKTRRGDGRARLDGELTAGALSSGEARVSDARLQGRFDGATTGWIEAFHIEGESLLDLTAGALASPGLTARGVQAVSRAGRLTLDRGDEAFRWSLSAPTTITAASGRSGEMDVSGLTLRSGALVVGGRDDAFEATGPVAARIDRFGFGDLTLRQATGALELDVVHDAATRISATGSLRAAEGGWPIFGAPEAADPADLVEMKRALQRFTLDAPGVAFTTGSEGTQVALTRSARLAPANGGVLTISQGRGGAYQAEPGAIGGGALNLVATRGRGLPEAQVAIPDWRLTDKGFEARIEATAALDFDLARGLKVRTQGLLANADGRLTYVTPDCVDLSVERLELDENDVTDVAGVLCPTSAPLLTSQNGAWRVESAFRSLSAHAPFLGLRFDDAEGALTATGGDAGLGLEARVGDAQVIDEIEPRRFNTLSASGAAALRDERWSGGFDLARAGARIGALTLAHDGRASVGGVTIDAPDLAFAEGGLQPSDLTPLVDGLVQSPVTGSVGFQGRIGWIEDGEGTSEGRLTVPGLDFASPAGAVHGLKGEVVFASLTPLVTASNQRLTIDRLETATDLTDLDVTFDLDAAALNLGGASVRAAGGVVSIEPFSAPLDRSQPIKGVIVLQGVQLGQVVSDSGFGERVGLDAVVSGRLPFELGADGQVRIVGGALMADQPGRLSIQREVLADVEAGGGGEDVPPGMVEDLAYQAMENLAFEDLTADLNSLDGGRVSVLFHIKGRHDPPQRQELRMSVTELISRQFLNRNLPLPSGTEIDLTLDTSLNLSQLVSDLLAINRARDGQMETTQ